MSKQKTHPVYIERERKTEVKKTAAEVDESMKTVTERYVEHGADLDLHDIPVTDDPIRHILGMLRGNGVLSEGDDGELCVSVDPETIPEPN